MKRLILFTMIMLICLIFMDRQSAYAAPQSQLQAELILFPDPPDVQGTIDMMLACRNGVIFDFYAAAPNAVMEEEPLDWDVSFAHDGALIINQFPLWLAESEVPRVRDGMTFPYRAQQMLLWRDRVPVGPLAMCISGPGTGFCERTVTIDNCSIAPSLVVAISQIGEKSTTATVTDSLVFETRAYDPTLGVSNGDGIDSVRMSVIDSVTGEDVFWGPPIAPSAVVTETTFCLFSEECAPYVFADNEYAWPNGTPIVDGAYLLRSHVSTPRNEQFVIQREIEIVGVPARSGDWENPVDGAVYVTVPEGEFVMGSDEDYADEAPQHVVSLDAYRIMMTEVTNAQFAACIEAGGCTTEPGGERWNDPAYARHPVTNVDWNQATEYATWVGGRLPTEAEWEKAARGDSGGTYPWGEAMPSDVLANVDAPTGDTLPVGSFPDGASPYGALDMAGNVEEWVSDWYDKTYYEVSPAANPLGPESPLPPLKVLRGGSYQQSRYDVRTSVRGRANPDASYGSVGFRVVTPIE